MLNKETTPHGNYKRDRPKAGRSKKQIADAKRVNHLLSILSEIKASR